MFMVSQSRDFLIVITHRKVEGRIVVVFSTNFTLPIQRFAQYTVSLPLLTQIMSLLQIPLTNSNASNACVIIPVITIFITDIVESSFASHHLHIDDIQLCISISPTDSNLYTPTSIAQIYSPCYAQVGY